MFFYDLDEMSLIINLSACHFLVLKDWQMALNFANTAAIKYDGL